MTDASLPPREQILVVDDEPDIRNMLKRLVETRLEDVEVITCASGEQALAILQATPVALIVSDHRMAGMTGIEFLRAARHIAPDVPSILLTGFGDLDIAVQALHESGVQNFLTKPFDVHETLATIEALLRLRLEHRVRVK